ncbi:MAG: hypothetical protein ACK4E3_11195 [Brevundimonas sp.]|jgi:hypothetical protein
MEKRSAAENQGIMAAVARVHCLLPDAEKGGEPLPAALYTA